MGAFLLLDSFFFTQEDPPDLVRTYLVPLTGSSVTISYFLRLDKEGFLGEVAFAIVLV